MPTPLSSRNSLRGFLGAPKSYTVGSFRHFWENSRRGARAAYGKDAWPKGMHFQINGREDNEKEEGLAKLYGDNYIAVEMQPFHKLIWNKQIVLPRNFSDFESRAFVPDAAYRAFDVFNAQ